MAQVEKVPDVGESLTVLPTHTNKSVARLLRENPYVAGVAVVSATCKSHSKFQQLRSVLIEQ